MSAIEWKERVVSDRHQYTANVIGFEVELEARPRAAGICTQLQTIINTLLDDLEAGNGTSD